MARMRWVVNQSTGGLAAVCPYCDTEIAVQVSQTAYCYCRSVGRPGQVVVRELTPPVLPAAA